ncbi:hypothetical protein [Novibacillus thermophilus]|uniref:Uncharacterized protein n=1 Tax=Novibacillus thermophilus TaxID=1471761 RepID=A0A1U9KAA6_9BACL|nr:hypothetical protein [Novibacillus thermophilus]AQS56968.1 hypothetical protein B0W44_15680 [Novibacillus thermophilus]
MLIEPLQDVCRLISRPEIEEERKTYTVPQQEEIFSLMKEIMTDDMHFVLAVYNRTEKEYLAH